MEKALYDVSNPVMTLGALAKAKRNPEGSLHAQELRCWEAGTDKLAIMLDIAASSSRHGSSDMSLMHVATYLL